MAKMRTKRKERVQCSAVPVHSGVYRSRGGEGFQAGSLPSLFKHCRKRCNYWPHSSLYLKESLDVPSGFDEH